MKCAQHPETEATAFCRQCGTALCPACMRDVRGAVYCENCLANLVGIPPAATGTAGGGVPLPRLPAAPGAPSPGVALALGFIPGLGAVYNGEYIKALIHVLAFGGIIALLTTDLPTGLIVILSIGLGCFYFYMPIEAYRTAKARRGEEIPETGLPAAIEGNRPVGAIVLIVLGALFLLANFHLLERDWFSKAWPAGLILLGAWILMDRIKRTS
jgi:LiaI-LiaF-like transmembrane region/B-box zinc finger